MSNLSPEEVAEKILEGDKEFTFNYLRDEKATALRELENLDPNEKQEFLEKHNAAVTVVLNSLAQKEIPHIGQLKHDFEFCTCDFHIETDEQQQKNLIRQLNKVTLDGIEKRNKAFEELTRFKA